MLYIYICNAILPGGVVASLASLAVLQVVCLGLILSQDSLTYLESIVSSDRKVVGSNPMAGREFSPSVP